MIKGSSKTVKKSTRTTIPKKECSQCLETKSITLFYSSDNKKDTYGVLSHCKVCISPEDINDIDEVKRKLLQINKPFLNDVWMSTKEECLKNKKPNGTFGIYLKNIKLKNTKYEKLTSKDTEAISEDLKNHEDEANEEEKIFSKKWMGKYTQSDIEVLDDYYAGLENDFKIVTTNHKDYAKKISKASLHMDKCFQEMQEGIVGADVKYKAARETFDTLSKSAQFSESQRGQNDVSLGCFGVTFDQVETKKWIPKHIPMEEDAIDKIINQFATIRESV